MSEEIKVWMPAKGYKCEDFGECVFVTPDFVTFMTDYPPAAIRAHQMWINGWEVYYQPVRRSEDHLYLTTYKRRTLK